MRMKKLLTFLTLLTLSIGVTWAATETVDFSAQGYSNQQEITSYTGTNFTVTFSQGDASNPCKYFSSGTAIRCYGGSQFTVKSKSSSENITSIVITFGSSDGTNEITTQPATYSNGTWTGDSESVVFSIQGSSGHRKIKALTVTIGGDTPQPTTYSITGTGAVTGGNVTASATSGITAGTSVTITATPSTGYDLSNLTVDDNDVTSSVNSSYQYTFSMPAHDVAVSATFTEQSTPQPSGSNRFERITNVNQLEAGKRYLLVYESAPAVMGSITTSGTKYGLSIEQTGNYTYSSGVITLNDQTNAKPLTLGGNATDGWTFSLDGALLNHTGKSNTLSTGTTNTTWNVSFESNGNAVIENKTKDTGNNTRYIKYNSTSGQLRFACYTSGQQPIQLYKEVTQQVEVSDLYVVGQVNGNDEDPFDPNEGVQLTYSQTNGTYSGDFYCKGMNGGYSYLLFSKSIPADFNNDKSNLYGAGGNGNAWIINESDYGTTIPLYATSSDSFRLPAGLYTVTIALSGAGFEYTDASVIFTKREKTMAINGSQYFEDTRDVTMTSNLTDIGGKIYYTTDGSNPSDPNSTRQEYTGAITISETTTFKAVAFIGNLYSDIVERTFTKTPKTPVISPESCTFSEPLTVTITCETAGATIRYTLDGTTPTSTSTEYTAPLTISETTTVKARAFVGETYSNGIATAEYVYTEPYVPGEGDFVLVTSKDDLKAGREYIIITKNHDWAMSAVDGDAKKATASQDFTISQDFSTVTLTENSTVNVMKLVDGVEDPDNKYWNLTQANGLNIYVQNTGTGIQEKAHGVGLSGYTDEVMINLTTSTNYAIITPGGRQILYQNGSNGAAGVFGHYANSNQDATGYQRVYLYYREGGEVTPEFKEVTLAELCATGVTTEGSNKYVISDMLQAVYADDIRGLLWCKDLGNKSISSTSMHEGDQVDFLMNDGLAQNGRAWDQSNWILLSFSTPDMENGVGQLVNNARDKFIKPGTIKGTLVNNTNYTLKMELDQLDLVTQADAGYSEDPYEENVYCPSNFLPENLNIWGSIEAGDGGYTTGNDQNYFFMNPKVQEVCYITYAEWNQEDNCFTVPTKSGFKGAFQVGWVYKTTQQVPTLQNGEVYNFHAVVQRTDKEHYGPNNPISAKDELPYSEYITVLPVDLTGDGNIITAINTVEVGKGEVKSVKYVNVAGMVSDVPFQGVNIVVTEYTDGTRTTSKMLRK